MHKTHKITAALCLFFAAVSCSSYTTAARREDLSNRCFSKTEIVAESNWKMGGNILVLKRNNTFRYTTDVMGITSEYYTGNYDRNGDTIVFNFTKNNRFFINTLKDTAYIGCIRNEKPAFFAKTATLILTQRNENSQRQDILCNKNNDYMTVVQTTQREIMISLA